MNTPKAGLPETPPVVAVMFVEKPSRIGTAARAILDFASQTYPDKHLFVAAFGESGVELRRLFGDWHSVSFVDDITSLQTQLYDRSRWHWQTYVAQWSNAARSNPLRVDRQVRALMNSGGGRPCFLSAGLLLFAETRELYVTDLEKRHDPLVSRVYSYTSMAAHQEVRTAWLADPDTIGHKLLSAAPNNDAVRPEGEWWYYVHHVLGDNVKEYEACRRIAADKHRCKPRNWVRERQQLIELWLSQFQWDADGRPYHLMGLGGELAFDWVPPLASSFLPGGMPDVYPVTGVTHSDTLEDESESAPFEPESPVAAAN